MARMWLAGGALSLLLTLFPVCVTGQAAAIAAEPAAAPMSGPPCGALALAATTPGRLTFKQQTCVYLDGLVTPLGLAETAVSAGWDQWTKWPVEWGPGAKGYGKRFAAGFATGIVKSTGIAAASFALGEDPRWHPKPGAGATLWRRVGQAVAAPFVQQKGGSLEPRFGILIGSLSSGFSGDLVYPPSQHTLGDGLSRAASSLGGSELASFFAEFEPEVRGLVSQVLGRKQR